MGEPRIEASDALISIDDLEVINDALKDDGKSVGRIGEMIIGYAAYVSLVVDIDASNLNLANTRDAILALTAFFQTIEPDFQWERNVNVIYVPGVDVQNVKSLIRSDQAIAEYLGRHFAGDQLTSTEVDFIKKYRPELSVSLKL